MERENLIFNSLLPSHRLLGWILGVALVISGVVLSGVAEYAVPLREGNGRFSFGVVSSIGL